jgi:hypothetical protein
LVELQNMHQLKSFFKVCISLVELQNMHQLGGASKYASAQELLQSMHQLCISFASAWWSFCRTN